MRSSDVPRQPVTGQGIQQENVGDDPGTVGVEVAHEPAAAQQSSQLAWSVGGTFNYNHNEVTDMGGVAGLQRRGRPEARHGMLGPARSERRQHLSRRPRRRLVPDHAGGHERRRAARRLRARMYTGTFPVARQERRHQHDDLGRQRPDDQRPGRLGRRPRSLRLWIGVGDLQRHLSSRARALRHGRWGEREGCAYAFPTQYRTDGTVRGKIQPERGAVSAFLYDGDYFKLREVSLRYVLAD